MRIVFAGTPEFAAAPLDALLQADADVVAVYTQPDRPAGRGRKLLASPVKQRAEQAGIPVRQPGSLKDAAVQAELRAWQADLMVVIAYGLILPQAVLDMPRLGCVNLHASLLPRWRGAAPIQRAIEAGDERTGLCLMLMDAGLDTGPVLACSECAIDAQMTGGDLHDALVRLGEQHLPGWLDALAAGELEPQAQDDAQATYAHKLTKAEARIDFAADAAVIARRIRAFNPWPVACAPLDGESVRLWTVTGIATDAGGVPGEIIAVDAHGLRVACGQGSVRIGELQWPGKRRMTGQEAARGRPLQGRIFG